MVIYYKTYPNSYQISGNCLGKLVFIFLCHLKMPVPRCFNPSYIGTRVHYILGKWGGGTKGQIAALYRHFNLTPPNHTDMPLKVPPRGWNRASWAYWVDWFDPDSQTEPKMARILTG